MQELESINPCSAVCEDPRSHAVSNSIFLAANKAAEFGLSSNPSSAHDRLAICKWQEVVLCRRQLPHTLQG